MEPSVCPSGILSDRHLEQVVELASLDTCDERGELRLIRGHDGLGVIALAKNDLSAVASGKLDAVAVVASAERGLLPVVHV
jgi:hypothetical protein